MVHCGGATALTEGGSGCGDTWWGLDSPRSFGLWRDWGEPACTRFINGGVDWLGKNPSLYLMPSFSLDWISSAPLSFPLRPFCLYLMPSFCLHWIVWIGRELVVEVVQHAQERDVSSCAHKERERERVRNLTSFLIFLFSFLISFSYFLILIKKRNPYFRKKEQK